MTSLDSKVFLRLLFVPLRTVVALRQKFQIIFRNATCHNSVLFHSEYFRLKDRSNHHVNSRLNSRLNLTLENQEPIYSGLN